MAKTDWQMEDTVLPDDMNDLGQEVNDANQKADEALGELGNATAAATPDTLIKRDPAGRAKVAAPAVADDIARKQEVDAHANRADNPHDVTKAQVGLGNVQNYGVASQAQAEAGTASNVYMTPQRTRQAINVIAGLLADLTTTQKSNLVAAINEVLSIANAALPKSGGLMTGNLTLDNSQLWIKNGTVSKRLVHSWGGDANGLGVAFGAGGRTVVYAGEAISDIEANLSPTAEDAVIAADTNVYLMAGLQNGWANRKELRAGGDGILRWDGQDVWTKAALRWNSGRLEYNDGGTWKAVGGVYRSYRTEFTLAASQTSFVNVINISNSPGVIPSIRCIEGSGSNVEFRVTLDGTVVFQGTFTGGIGNGSAFDIARGFFTSSDSPPSIYFKTSAQISIRYVNPTSNICRLAVTYAI